MLRYGLRSMGIMVEYIKLKDLETILRYARIYGLANGRKDILTRCRIFGRKLSGRSPNEKIGLNTNEGISLGKLCLYAVASAGSCGEAGKDVCRIAREHSKLMNKDDRASAMAIADMLKDAEKGDECPFYLLYQFLEKEETGELARN